MTHGTFNMDLPETITGRKQPLSQNEPLISPGSNGDGSKSYLHKPPAYLSEAKHSRAQEKQVNPLSNCLPSNHPKASSKKSRSKLNHSRSYHSNQQSYIITLKVKVSNMALESGQFRQSHRERRPTEKMRQLKESSDIDELVQDGGIVRHEDDKETLPRRTPATKSGRKATTGSRKQRRRAQSVDTDYKSPTEPRRQRGRQHATDTDSLVGETPGLIIEEKEELQPEERRELTLDDFEAPTAYGFPLRVARDVDETIQEPQSTTSLNLQPAKPQEDPLHDDQPLTVIRRAVLPNTLEFWMDWFMAEQASKSSDLDFKMMCLNLMKLRAQAEIPKITVNNPLTQGRGIYFFGRRVDQHEPATTRGYQSVRSILPPYGVDCRKDPDDSSILLTFTDWDVLLASIKIARKEMYRRRRWRLKGKFNEAGWAVWEAKMRRESRGSFVEDNQSESHSTADIKEFGTSSNHQRGSTVMQDLDESVVEKWWMSLSTKGIGYRRKGIDIGGGVLAYPTGSHWEEIETAITTTTGSSIAQHTDSGEAVADVRQVIRGMAHGQGVVEEAVEEDVLSDEEWSRDLPNVRRKLFTAEALAKLTK